MNGELDCKIILKPESVIQVKDLKEGIWAVYKIPNGKHMTHVVERVEDLPEALRFSQVEAIRYDISKEISNALVEAGVVETFRAEGLSVKGIVNNIFKTFKDKETAVKK